MKRQNNKFLSISILFIPIILLGIFHYRGKKMNQDFFKGKVDATILDSSAWQGRTIEYYLPGGLQIDITSFDSIQIHVGDSISKKANTFEYNIYRKNGIGVFEFYKKSKVDRY